MKKKQTRRNRCIGESGKIAAIAKNLSDAAAKVIDRFR